MVSPKRPSLQAFLPALSLLTALGAGCGDPDGARRVPDLSECDGDGPEQVLVARRIVFARADETGTISEGFDLDGGDGSIGCGVDDYVDPDGVSGIDNAMAGLIPVLETTEAAVIEPLMQDSVNGGALLLMFGLTDFDDEAADECVDVEVFKGLGIPMIGNDGWMLPNQTFGVNPDTPVTPAPTASLVEGRLDVGPIEAVDLTLVVLDLNTTVTLSDVQVRLEPMGNGTWQGIVAGGVAVQDIVDVATLQNVDPAVFDLIEPVLNLLADLDPDESGQCQRISMTLLFEAVPAFVYEDFDAL